MSNALAGNPSTHVVGIEYDTDLAMSSPPETSGDSIVVSDARSLPFSNDAFDAITSVNTLHEVIYATGNVERHAELDSTVSGLARVLKPNGTLIVFDGLMPDNEDKPLLVRANDDASVETLLRFRNEYVARTPLFEQTDERTFESDLASVATFLTKYNYLRDGEAWDGERHQLYPFTNLQTLTDTLLAQGLSVEAVRFPDAHSRKGLKALLANYAITSMDSGQEYTTESFPICQALLTACKK